MQFENFPAPTTLVRKCPYCAADGVEEGIFEDEGGGKFSRTDACGRCDGSWRMEFAFTQWAVVLHPSTLTLDPVEQTTAPVEPGVVLSFRRG